MIHEILSTFFYVGYLTAPGTCATIASVPFVIFLKNNFNFYQYIIFTFFFTILAIKISDKSEKLFKNKDPKQIVIDEFAGFLYVFLFIDLTKFNILIGIILFRFFDIFKPLFIKKIQNLNGGLGIVLDDVLAGIYSSIVLIMINYFTNK